MNESFFCKASIQRISTFDGWCYRCCPNTGCYRELKQQEDTDAFTCNVHSTQTPIPNFKVHMTIHGSDDQANVILKGKSAEQFFGCSCEESVNAKSITMMNYW